MNNPVKHIDSYFKAPPDYFWLWMEDGLVIEWKYGQTICYRDDLIKLLRNFPDGWVPPLGAILLVLGSINKDIHSRDKVLLNNVIKPFANPDLENILAEVLAFLKLIHKLPEELKRGTNRSLLLSALFPSETVGAIHKKVLNDLLDELDSGRMDDSVKMYGEHITKETIWSDLSYLNIAAKRYPTIADLELQIKTGVSTLPTAAPSLVAPAPAPGLLQQLMEDQSTAGLSNLAQRLMPILNIPLHTKGGDQSYGGISDITNRGNYDRLLLSELANDDSLLMARLVNNEALYLRREQPPNSPKRKRTILIDTTIKMWGIPRIFALSTALAFCLHRKKGEEFETFLLFENDSQQVDMTTKEGVIEAMSKMDHALHCGVSLEKLLSDAPAISQNEFILITDKRLLKDPGFIGYLTDARELLSFLVSVDRDGEINFFEYNKGKSSLINKAKLDLDEILSSAFQYKNNITTSVSINCAFFNFLTSPLLYPKPKIKQTVGRAFIISNSKLVYITDHQRVFLMDRKEKGAKEIMSLIEKGMYVLGNNSLTELFILVWRTSDSLIKIYKFRHDVIETTIDLSEKIRFVNEVSFSAKRFFIKTNNGQYNFNCDSQELVEEQSSDFVTTIGISNTGTFNQSLNFAISSYYPGSIGRYNLMFKIKNVFIDDKGYLNMGNYHFKALPYGDRIRLNENTIKRKSIKEAKEIYTMLSPFANKSVKINVWKWKEGTELFIDSRGLFHLKSADKSLPEITVALIVGACTSCWSSNGYFCGEDYFHISGHSSKIPVNTFYDTYIEPILKKIS